MDQAGFTQVELAEAVNAELRQAGHEGSVSERTVRYWLTGKTACPYWKQRAALEAVFGCTIEQLGFTPSDQRKRPALPQEDPLRRRTFLTASTGTALAAGYTRRTIGTPDVHRLREHLAELWLLDDQEGGGPELEKRALRLCSYTEELQQNGNATSRIRSRLYALAATFTATAMWAAVDSRCLDRAQRHMEKAITLAGLSGDGQVQHQIWRVASALASQRGRWADAVAASEAAMATSVHRRDPLYASLSHVRLAVSLPGTGDFARTLRALDRAETAFDRADLGLWRPASMGFYNRSELEGLTGIAYLRIGQPGKAEFHLHRCLAALRPDQHRNRALYSAHVAFAQLEQLEAEQACTTAARVIPPRGSTESGRIPHLLTTFTERLNRLAADAPVTREWNARTLTA
jgi:hypothetical protein